MWQLICQGKTVELPAEKSFLYVIALPSEIVTYFYETNALF